MNELTPEQLKTLLSQTSEQRMRQVALDMGIDLDDAVQDWGLQVDPGDVQTISAHLAFVRDRSPEEVQEYIALRDADPDVLEAQRRASEFDASLDERIASGEITEAEAEQEREQELGIGRRKEPRWVLIENGGPLTVQQQSRLVRYVNTYYGESFETYDALVNSGYFTDATQQVKDDLAAAVLDLEPTRPFEVQSPSGPVHVTARQWEAAKTAYGVDDEDVSVLIRMADRAGIRGADGEYVAWQPLAMFLKSTGQLDELMGHTDRLDDLRREQEQIRLGQRPSGVLDSNTGGELFGTLSRLDQGSTLGTMEVTDPFESFDPVTGAPVTTRRNVPTIQAFEIEYSRYLQRYKNPAMAYIATKDPVLAKEIDTGFGDEVSHMKLARIVANSGFPTVREWYASMPEQGYAEFQASPNLEQLIYSNAADRAEFLGRSSEIAATEPRTLFPDPEGVNEALRSLYLAMFDTEPDEGTMARFRSQINSAVSSADDNDLASIDIAARARKFARNDPRYDDLYGQRPENVTEEQYQGQFEAAQRSMLGAEVAGNVPKHTGMRSGKYQTTVGAAAGTEEAWDNSTFMGRLARAADIVGANT